MRHLWPHLPPGPLGSGERLLEGVLLGMCLIVAELSRQLCSIVHPNLLTYLQLEVLLYRVKEAALQLE